MINRFALSRRLAFMAGAAIIAQVAWAQGFEVSGFGGATTFDGGVGTHPSYGAAAGVKLGDNVHLFGEFSFARLASEPFSQPAQGSTPAITGTANVNLASYGGGVDYSFGSSTSRVRPYVLVAAGVGHFYATGNATAGGVTTNVSIGVTNDLYVGAGGGVRLYLGKHWGLKPEARYQRYNNSNAFGISTGGMNAVQYSLGVFFGS